MKYSNLLAFAVLINTVLFTESVLLYIQNDTPKIIKYARNESSVMLYNVKPGSRASTTSENLQALYAKYEDSPIYRKLNLGTALQDAHNGVSSVIHIVPGTVYGVKVGSIEKK